MPTMMRPGPLITDTDTHASYTRAWQVLTQLEESIASLQGAGVVTGGAVTATTGYSVQVASGTVLHQEGVFLTLGSAQAYTAAVAGATIRLWGKITRTAASKTLPNAQDSYVLTLTHTADDPAAPAGYTIPLARWTTDGSGVVAGSIVDPAGKYIRRSSGAFTPVRDTIGAHETQYVNAGEQVSVFGSLTVEGNLVIGGKVRVTP